MYLFVAYKKTASDHKQDFEKSCKGKCTGPAISCFKQIKNDLTSYGLRIPSNSRAKVCFTVTIRLHETKSELKRIGWSGGGLNNDNDIVLEFNFENVDIVIFANNMNDLVKSKLVEALKSYDMNIIIDYNIEILNYKERAKKSVDNIFDADMLAARMEVDAELISSIEKRGFSVKRVQKMAD